MQRVIILLLAFIFGLDLQAQESLKHKAALAFSLPDTLKAAQWFTEVIPVNIPATKSVFLGSQFSNGYVGLAVSDKGIKSFRFHIDHSTETRVVAMGLNVQQQEGNGFLEWEYNWQQRHAYQLLLTIIADSVSQSTFYTAYIHLPVEDQWKLIGSIQKMNDGRFISQPALAIQAKKKNSFNKLKLSLRQSWVQRSNGSWKELQEVVFRSNTSDAGFGTDSSRFFVSGRNHVNGSSVNEASLSTNFVNKRPVIDVTRHLDSLAQFQQEIALLNQAVADKKIDTTGTNGSVYYKILKEGTGNVVAVTDTIEIFYKGSLFADGSIFDQTKEKPANFPLARLIKGWQLGLVKCKVGGSIRLFIPSALAYSIRSRSKAIPPNSILVFDIEIVSTKKAL